MSHKRLNLQLVPIFFAFSLLFSCQSNNNQDNFNGGFEQRSTHGNDPAGWYATRPSKTNSFTHFEVDSLIKHQGKYSVSIAIDTAHPKDTIAYNWTRAYDSFIVGKEYTVSGWLKTDNLSSPGFIVIQCWDANQSMIGFATTQRDFPINGTSDWTYAEKEFTVPDGTSELRIRIGIATPDNIGGKVWFDDIKLE